MNNFESTPQEPEQNLFSASGQALPQSTQTKEEPAELFHSWSQPEVVPPPRIPHLGHLALLMAFMLFGFVCMMVLMFTALHFHLDGISTPEQIKTNAHYLLGSEAVLYLVALALSFPLFPLLWKKSFFAGIHWRGATALEFGWRLPAISLGCFILAMLDQALLPGPEHAPIEEFFRTPGAAWLMFGFGVTFAPFFEEMFFRGFLLPALATAWDWIGEYIRCENEWLHPLLVLGSSIVSTIFAILIEETYGHHYIIMRFLLICFISIMFGMAFFWLYQRYQALHADRNAPPLDPNGHPQWSIFAMVFASIPTSILFALLHTEQQGNSLNLFLMFILISLVLCAVRLLTRSLAASTLVHACYNFLIFFSLFVGTGGFRHFDKL